MSIDQSSSNQRLIALLAASITAALTLAYFLIDLAMHEQSMKAFLQGIFGNIIATTLSCCASKLH